jgi:hypothetical protein
MLIDLDAMDRMVSQMKKCIIDLRNDSAKRNRLSANATKAGSKVQHGKVSSHTLKYIVSRFGRMILRFHIRLEESIIKSAGNAGTIVRGEGTEHVNKDFMETYVTGLVPGAGRERQRSTSSMRSSDADPQRLL